VSRPKSKRQHVRRDGGHREFPALVRVPEIVKCRDEGKITAAECAVWSSLLQYSGVLKSLKDSTLDTDEITIVDLRTSERAQAESVTATQLHIYAPVIARFKLSAAST
jgi:hypothetical protein